MSQDAQRVSPLPRASAVLSTAERIITGDRQRAYNHPRKNMRSQALIWTGILHQAGWVGPGGENDILPDRVVALMSAGIKLSRDAHHPQPDNLIDGCGYLALAAELGDVSEGGPSTEEVGKKLHEQLDKIAGGLEQKVREATSRRISPLLTTPAEAQSGS